MQVYAEGTHLMVPWFERPVIYDVRAKPHLVESTSGSRDLQMVTANFQFSHRSFLLHARIFFLFHYLVDLLFPFLVDARRYMLFLSYIRWKLKLEKCCRK